MKSAATLFENDSARTAPFYPKAESVRGRVLGALLRGNRLTQGDALRRFGTSRLGAAICSLREGNWPIATRMIEIETSDAGRKAHIARYSIPCTDIAQAGEQGRQFAELAREIEEARRRH